MDHRKKSAHTTQRGYIHQQHTSPSKTYNTKSSLVGECNEVSVRIFDIETRALLDTGSTVSTINEAFYRRHFPDIPLQSLDFALSVECADGLELPYLGYIALDLQVIGVPALPLMKECLFLVVNESSYNSKVPALIETNLLSVIMQMTKDVYGDQFLQKANMYMPWYLSM
jgi:hypothetical protein